VNISKTVADTAKVAIND